MKFKFKFLLITIIAMVFNTAIAEDENRFYGNFKFSTKFSDESVKTQKSPFVSMEIFDKESPMQYNFVLGNETEYIKNSVTRRSADYLMLSAKYRIGANSIGVLFDKDNFRKYSQTSLSFALNTDGKPTTTEFVPYAYGYLGKKNMDDGRSAGVFYGYSGIKRQVGKWGFFGALDIEHTSWKHVNDDTSVILFKPRVRYFLDDSEVNAITIYGETGVVRSSVMQDSKISTYGLSIDYLIFEKTKLNIDLYSNSKNTNGNNLQLNKGAKLEIIKFF